MDNKTKRGMQPLEFFDPDLWLPLEDEADRETFGDLMVYRDKDGNLRPLRESFKK